MCRTQSGLLSSAITFNKLKKVFKIKKITLVVVLVKVDRVISNASFPIHVTRVVIRLERHGAKILMAPNKSVIIQLAVLANQPWKQMGLVLAISTVWLKETF